MRGYFDASSLMQRARAQMCVTGLVSNRYMGRCFLSFARRLSTSTHHQKAWGHVSLDTSMGDFRFQCVSTNRVFVSDLTLEEDVQTRVIPKPCENPAAATGNSHPKLEFPRAKVQSIN